jgi:hypothetical protein
LIPATIETITIWLFNIAMENHHFSIGKPSINGPFSMAMLNNQRVEYGHPHDLEDMEGSSCDLGKSLAK